jgi:hypothetical protein
LAELYQASTKEKGKGIEMNFACHSDMGYFDTPNGEDITHLDVFDFFEDPNEKIDHLIVIIKYFLLLSQCIQYVILLCFYFLLK